MQTEKSWSVLWIVWSLCPPQILYGLLWQWTQAFTLRCWQLTVRAVVQTLQFTVLSSRMKVWNRKKKKKTREKGRYNCPPKVKVSNYYAAWKWENRVADQQKVCWVLWNLWSAIQKLETAAAHWELPSSGFYLLHNNAEEHTPHLLHGRSLKLWQLHIVYNTIDYRYCWMRLHHHRYNNGSPKIGRTSRNMDALLDNGEIHQKSGLWKFLNQSMHYSGWIIRIADKECLLKSWFFPAFTKFMLDVTST